MKMGIGKMVSVSILFGIKPRHKKPKDAIQVTEEDIGSKIKSTSHAVESIFLLIRIHNDLCECERLWNGARHTFKLDTCYYTTRTKKVKIDKIVLRRKKKKKRKKRIG